MGSYIINNNINPSNGRTFMPNSAPVTTRGRRFNIPSVARTFTASAISVPSIETPIDPTRIFDDTTDDTFN